jgi:hypothetical protein
LHEGLAQYFEAGTSTLYTSQLRSAAASGRLITLRTRNNVPALGSEIGLFYTQAGSFTGELIELYGTERMANTLSAINDGMSATEAVELTYGTPLWALENEWRVRLGASELPPPAEPGPAAQPTASQTPVPPATGEPSGGTAAIPQATATPQSSPIPVIGVEAGEEEPQDGGRFIWRGPMIGMLAAVVVFAIWSFRTNRRRLGSRRR